MIAHPTEPDQGPTTTASDIEASAGEHRCYSCDAQLASDGQWCECMGDPWDSSPYCNPRSPYYRNGYRPCTCGEQVHPSKLVAGEVPACDRCSTAATTEARMASIVGL